MARATYTMYNNYSVTMVMKQSVKYNSMRYKVYLSAWSDDAIKAFFSIVLYCSPIVP